MEGVQCHKKASEIKYFYSNLTSIFCYRNDGNTEGISSDQIEKMFIKKGRNLLVELSQDGQNWTICLCGRVFKMRSSNSTYMVRRRPKLVNLASAASAIKI